MHCNCNSELLLRMVQLLRIMNFELFLHPLVSVKFLSLNHRLLERCLKQHFVVLLVRDL